MCVTKKKVKDKEKSVEKYRTNGKINFPIQQKGKWIPIRIFNIIFKLVGEIMEWKLYGHFLFNIAIPVGAMSLETPFFFYFFSPFYAPFFLSSFIFLVFFCVC